MINVLLCVLLAAVVILCLSSLLWHRRQGELCDCPGDCDNCRIQCRSNMNYYGTAAQNMPVMTPMAKNGSGRRAACHKRLRKYAGFWT